MAKAGSKLAESAVKPSTGPTVKVLMVGDAKAGKSTLMKKLLGQQIKDDYEPTMAIDHAVYPVTIDGKKFKIQFWDTSGQERFQSLTTAYYRGVHAAVVVYDVTAGSAALERATTHWVNRIKEHCVDENVDILIVGTKVDQLVTDAKTTFGAATMTTGSKSANLHIQTSCKDPKLFERFEQAFYGIVLAVYERITSPNFTPPPLGGCVMFPNN